MSAEVGEVVLEARGLAVRRGRTVVVRDVDLQVRRGEVVALLGPNGAGKSTLLEALAGLVEVHGGTLDRRGRVAAVLQTPGLARRSVAANLGLALRWWGVPRSERAARATQALEAMRATHLARRHATALSGGERRRVHVARGLALQPDLLLLDEPFAGVDAETRAALCDDAASALRRPDRAVVVVLHDRDDAWALADRIVVVIDGRLAADASPSALLASPPNPEVARFLGFDGELVVDGHLTMSRSAQVTVDSRGELEGEVHRVVRGQDVARLEVRCPTGTLRATVVNGGGPVPAPGETVRLRVVGAVRFPAIEDALR